jgi:hypothetical protein
VSSACGCRDSRLTRATATHVRFTPESNIVQHDHDVRFVPIADMVP